MKFIYLVSVVFLFFLTTFLIHSCKKNADNAIKDSDGNIQGLIGIITDITNLKKAEESLREKTMELDNYFTNALDLFCIADIDGYGNAKPSASGPMPVTSARRC